MVIPKRHARRSVTRNLIKRQMREVMADVVQQARQLPAEGSPDALPRGLWVLRLKSPFDPKQFSSPASVPLRQAAREEIALLLTRALTPLPPGQSQGRRPRRDPSPSAAPGSSALPLHSAPSA